MYKKIKPDNGSSLRNWFPIFSAIFFLIILVAGSIAFIFSMRTITRANKGAELTTMLKVQQIMLESLVNSDISIVLKLADSPFIRRYFADPDGVGLEGVTSQEISSSIMEIALEEISSYGLFFSEGYNIFWISDVDRIFYMNNNTSYWLDADNPDNYWYNMTLFETEVYNFNINYNPDIQAINLWINAPVFDNDHKPIGMVGTGIDLSTFIDRVYQNAGQETELFFFNGLSEITGAREINLVADKIDIMSVLNDKGIDIFAEAKRLEPGETQTFDTPNGKLAIGTVPLLEWYTVAFMADSISDFNTAMTALFLVMLALILLIFIIFNMAIARYLKSLHETMESLKVASETKSRFIANMSHEMRTPMNSIIGFSELAINNKLPAETKAYLDKILINSELLLQLINDVLDISKIESGGLELENAQFDLHELLTSSQTMISPKAQEKGVNLYFYAEPTVGRKLIGDSLRLLQVLINLLSNAVKFTSRDGMVKVSATLIEHPDSSPEGAPYNDGAVTILFEIKDSGIGISPEQLEQILLPFERVDMATTRKFGGTGLGLAISKNIIDKMGGKFMVESMLGVGSKFSFEVTLPTVETVSDDSDVLTKTDNSQFKGEILICEDNDMNQQVLCEHLRRVGIKADVAENGRECFNMVRRRREKGERQYDLIFMDIHMPVMDGLEATKLILGLDKNIPIIAMTANVMAYDRELYKKTGMKDCLGKPFRVQELYSCLSKYIKTGKWNSEPVVEDEQFDDKLKFTLMNTFLKDNRGRYGEITNALNCGDIKLAHRLVHTLKSSAALLGKSNLQNASADAEHLLENGENQLTQEHLDALETGLKAAIADVERNVKENTLPPADAISEEEARETLSKLKPLLESGSANCLKYIDNLRRIQGSNERLIQRLIQQMEDLDFEEALETFNKLIGD